MRNQFHARIPEMTRNLRHLWKKETNDADKALGLVWYDDANRIMREWSDSYSYPIAVCAAVTAAISPQCDWTRNVIIADDVLAMREPSIGGAIHSNVDKARFLRDNRQADTRLAFKSGPKVYAFSQNLAGNYDVVTVDTHATQAALCDVEATVKLTQAPYDCFAEAYVIAAHSLKLEPAVFQAIIWHTWKRIYPPTTKIRLRSQWSAMGEV